MLYILVPYRAGEDQPHRKAQLDRFLSHMPHVLGESPYQIVVCQQNEGAKFNRGSILNCGFQACAPQRGDSVIFHDVDLLPSQDLRPYYDGDNYSGKVVHIGNLFERYPSEHYIGGVLRMPAETFRKINGFPNLYFGWGGEDDEMGRRLRAHGVNVHKVQEGQLEDLENMTLGQKLDHLRATRQKCYNKRELKDYYNAQRASREFVEGLNQCMHEFQTQWINDTVRYVYVQIATQRY